MFLLELIWFIGVYVHLWIWKYPIFISVRSILVSKIPHNFIESRHPEVTKNLYYALSTSRSQILIFWGSSSWTNCVKNNHWFEFLWFFLASFLKLITRKYKLLSKALVNVGKFCNATYVIHGNGACVIQGLKISMKKFLKH